MTEPAARGVLELGSKNQRHFVAVMLVVMVAFLNSVDAVLVRVLTTELHPLVIGFFRALFGLLFVLPWIATRPGILKSHYRWLHALRAALKLAALVSFFVAIKTAPLADVTAIAFAAPVLVTLGALLFLGEVASRTRLVAVAMGFVGVLIILRPGESGINPALGYALLGAILTAVIHLMLKRMSANDDTTTLVAWNLILSVPIAAIPALMFWSLPSLMMISLLALQGVIGAINMTAVTKATSYVDISIIAPIDFLRLPFVALMSFVFFQEAVGISTWVGAAIIFVATLFMASTGRFWQTRSTLP